MMLQQLEETEEADAVAFLIDEHTTARGVLAEAERVLSPGVEAGTVARVAACVHRFLTFTHPLHEVHEEQSLFPALRAYGPKDEVDAALAYVVDEHIEFDALRDELALRWSHVADAPAALAPLRAELLVKTQRLIRALSHHAEHEELVVFPLARKHVPPAIRAQLAQVMRRDVE